MRMADRWIRICTLLTVVCIAAFAAVISYQHIYDVSRTHGQSPLDAQLMPLATDGLITAAILASFYTTRRGLPVPWLARFALALGIVVTIGANSLYGVKYGVLGAVISSWPAISFVVAAELSIHTVRITVTGGRSRRSSSKRGGVARAWARNQGFDVADRGRLPGEALAAYEASNGEAVTLPNAGTVTTPNGHGATGISLVKSESG
jgi:Protein of unknown function (DUF2637)